jgi:hypothetical protein
MNREHLAILKGDDDCEEISTSWWNFLAYLRRSDLFDLGDKQFDTNRDNFNNCWYSSYRYQQKEMI